MMTQKKLQKMAFPHVEEEQIEDYRKPEAEQKENHRKLEAEQNVLSRGCTTGVQTRSGRRYRPPDRYGW